MYRGILLVSINFKIKDESQMKKCLLTFIAILFLLTGCSQVMVNNPHEISINGKILSYGDSEDNIDIKFFNIGDSATDVIPNKDENMIDVNDDGNIRCISIVDNKITTYKNISVGDSINKIEESFEHEYNMNNNYMVIFNNEIEEDPMNQNKEEDWLWINYITDGKNITRIQIYDCKYGNEMR